MVHNIDNHRTDVLQFFLTKEEALLLDAASHVQFGELLRVDLKPGTPTVSKTISKGYAAFVEKVRKEGLTFFHTVVIHNGVPTQAEIDGQFGDIHYRRKIRFIQ